MARELKIVYRYSATRHLILTLVRLLIAWRDVITEEVLIGSVNTTGDHELCRRVSFSTHVSTGSRAPIHTTRDRVASCSRATLLTPVNTARRHGGSKWHPWYRRLVNTASEAMNFEFVVLIYDEECTSACVIPVTRGLAITSTGFAEISPYPTMLLSFARWRLFVL